MKGRIALHKHRTLARGGGDGLHREDVFESTWNPGFWPDDLDPGCFVEKKVGRCPATKNGAPESLDTSPLLRVNLDIPARDRVLCLVVRISLCIGAVPDLDIEMIDIHTRLAVVLRLHPEGVQAITVDRSCALELCAHCAYRQPVDARALEVDAGIDVLEVQLACRYVVLVLGCEPEVGFTVRKCAVTIRIEPAALPAQPHSLRPVALQCGRRPWVVVRAAGTDMVVKICSLCNS